jgi:carbon storage regulator CsrA
MLVLKRRRDQSVRIGPDVVVKIIAIQNGAVTLAITAPSSFKITRDNTPDLDGANANKTIRSSGNDCVPRPSELDEAPGGDVAQGGPARSDEPEGREG